MKLTGKQGELRILDSKAVIHGAAPLDNHTIDVVKFDGVSTYTNITTAVEADDVSIATAFLADSGDMVFIGSTSRFAMIKYLKGNGTNYGIATGALLVTYYNGTNFATAVIGGSDGTFVSPDCFAQDGYISFEIPDDWVRGAATYNAALDADKYYIGLATTGSGTTDPDADVLAPVDGQYFTISFAQMDFSGPMGRPKVDEILVLDRGKQGAKSHYIESADGKIYVPQEISFSCYIDDVYNKADILTALACGSLSTSRWDAIGVTSKGTTKNDGSNYNPAFTDATKKTVNVHILFDESRAVTKTQVKPKGYAYYETYFPLEEQSVAESEDGTVLTCRGAVYGVICPIHGFGNQF